MSTDPVLELRGISFRYPDTDRQVVRDLSLTVASGETLCILGASGCGKSTVLKIAGSLISPDAGTVRLAGSTVTDPGPERIVVFQDQDQLFPWKTVLANTLFPLQQGARIREGREAPAGRSARKTLQRERAGRALAEVELTDAVTRYPHQLSGGMRQRVALARAIVIEPAALLLDEPFAAVDAPTRERLGALLVQLRRRHNPGILFVTHDVDEALRIGDRVIVLGRDGTVVLGETVPVGSAARAELGRQIRSVM